MGLIVPPKSQQNLPLQQKKQLLKSQLKNQLKLRQNQKKESEDFQLSLILETHAGLKVKPLHHKSLSLEPLAE